MKFRHKKLQFLGQSIVKKSRDRLHRFATDHECDRLTEGRTDA